MLSVPQNSVPVADDACSQFQRARFGVTLAILYATIALRQGNPARDMAFNCPGPERGTREEL
jgi:hypothetical protein